MSTLTPDRITPSREEAEQELATAPWRSRIDELNLSVEDALHHLRIVAPGFDLIASPVTGNDHLGRSKIIFTETVPLACILADGTNYLNPVRWLDADMEERAFILAHEGFHLVLDWFGRLMDKDPELWNIAQDHVINRILVQAGLKIYDRPDFHLYLDAAYDELADTDIYALELGKLLDAVEKEFEKLQKKQQQNGQQQNGQQGGNDKKQQQAGPQDGNDKKQEQDRQPQDDGQEQNDQQAGDGQEHEQDRQPQDDGREQNDQQAGDGQEHEQDDPDEDGQQQGGQSQNGQQQGDGQGQQSGGGQGQPGQGGGDQGQQSEGAPSHQDSSGRDSSGQGGNGQQGNPGRGGNRQNGCQQDLFGDDPSMEHDGPSQNGQNNGAPASGTNGDGSPTEQQNGQQQGDGQGQHQNGQPKEGQNGQPKEGPGQEGQAGEPKDGQGQDGQHKSGGQGMSEEEKDARRRLLKEMLDQRFGRRNFRDCDDSMTREIMQEASEGKRPPLPTALELNMLLLQAVQQFKKEKGSLPGDLEILAEETGDPEVPWERYVNRTVSRVLKGEWGYNPPHRMNPVLHKILPHASRGGRKIMYPGKQPLPDEIWVVFDTSGSMLTPDELGGMLTEMKSLLKKFKRPVRFISCDAKIHVNCMLKDITEVKRNIRGGGGTSTVPVFDLLKMRRGAVPPLEIENPKHNTRLSGKPAIVIYFSDLVATFPPKEEKPDTTVLWVYTGDPSTDHPTPPFGEVINMRGRKRGVRGSDKPAVRQPARR